MILVDTSIWIDHLKRNDATLSDLLNRCQVLMHPSIIGELALGSMRHGNAVIAMLNNLPHCVIAQHEEVLHLIRNFRLDGCGIGYVDANLLASVRLTGGASLWTRDKKLQKQAERLSIMAAL